MSYTEELNQKIKHELVQDMLILNHMKRILVATFDDHANLRKHGRPETIIELCQKYVEIANSQDSIREKLYMVFYRNKKHKIQMEFLQEKRESFEQELNCLPCMKEKLSKIFSKGLAHPKGEGTSTIDASSAFIEVRDRLEKVKARWRKSYDHYY